MYRILWVVRPRVLHKSPPEYLLSPPYTRGIHRSTFRSHFIEWRQASTFGITHIGTRKMVGWDPTHQVSKLGKTNQFICGYALALPDTYGLKAEELAELLNRLRDEHMRPET